ncbi:MAG: ABC transporter ATP-binding protein/permease [Actinobacteria bacterium]|nr:ABC transporter ATP-binding protein/permease [Actinomycetota bacterium]MBW3647970.1 ABC transporter ATP-binding protein/permease [Actinomycetota bacterium]
MREWLRTISMMVAISLRADAPRSAAAVLTAVGQMASLPFQAIGLKILTDGVVARDSGHAFRGVAVVLLFALLNRLSAHASLNIRMRLRESTQLYVDTHIMGLTAGLPSIEHHERPEYLDQVELIRTERGYLANPFNPISWTVASIVQGISIIALLAGVHPALAFLLLLGVPTARAAGTGQQRLVALVDGQSEANRLLRHFYDLTTKPESAKEVRVFGVADELLRRRRQLYDRLERERQGLAVRQVLSSTGAWLLFAAGYVAAIVWTAAAARRGDATVGDVVLVLSLGSQVDRQLTQLGENVAWFVRTHRAVRRLRWFSDYAGRAHAALTPAAPAQVPERLVDGIRIEQLGFSYPGTTNSVLRNVTLHLPAGSTVAIVGENGAGKTTLVKLLLRLYEPTSGRILIDGVDLRDLPVEAWRLRTSAAFQDFGQLQLLARETVGVGDTSQSDDDPVILAAMTRAAAPDVELTLPDGWSTQLGRDFEGGADLSLGQWQKLALGRAMMRPAPLLLVLDEPTASLDAPTEHRLFDRFHGAASEAAQQSGAITILVSHRFSTVRMADLILVIADGHIAETGDHNTLIAQAGLYAELYELQARSYR